MQSCFWKTQATLNELTLTLNFVDMTVKQTHSEQKSFRDLEFD